MAAFPALPAAIHEIPGAAIAEELWEEAGWLPCHLTVELPAHNFRVRDLLSIEPGAILDTDSLSGADLPVRANGQLIAWAEFEVVGQRLAVRLTELA
jgi:flagellar motor switch/type III secretory pathway protein FliN